MIRKALLEDAAQITEAAREVAREPGLLCSHPLEIDEELVKQTISSPKNIYLVAQEENTIVGHAFLAPLPLRSICHVAQATICVHKGYQKRGVGTKLLEALIALARESSTIEKIELNVRASNKRAIRLYKKMGFHQEGKLRNRVKVDGEYFDDILMALSVRSLTKEMQYASTPAQIRQCYELIKQLRPHFPCEEAFLAQVQRQISQGYQLVYIQEDGKIEAAIGFRIAEFLAWGKTLYIDDLIANSVNRGNGLGRELLQWVIEKAKQSGCAQIHLDSGFQRHEAHKLYLHQGFKIIAHHFALHEL